MLQQPIADVRKQWTVGAKQKPTKNLFEQIPWPRALHSGPRNTRFAPPRPLRGPVCLQSGASLKPWPDPCTVRANLCRASPQSVDFDDSS